MIYNAGWANLKPQESKFTYALAVKAAKLLEAGETLSAVARELNLSRATLRNWRDRNPDLNKAFTFFEQNKAKKAAHQLHVRKYKQVAEEIVEAAKNFGNKTINPSAKPKVLLEVGKVIVYGNKVFKIFGGSTGKNAECVVVLDRSAPNVKIGDQLVVKRGEDSWLITVSRFSIIAGKLNLVCFTKQRPVKDQIKVGDKVFR